MCALPRPQAAELVRVCRADFVCSFLAAPSLPGASLFGLPSAAIVPAAPFHVRPPLRLAVGQRVVPQLMCLPATKTGLPPQLVLPAQPLAGHLLRPGLPVMRALAELSHAQKQLLQLPSAVPQAADHLRLPVL